MNETLIPKEFGVEDGEMSASNGVVVSAIWQVDRHPHQMAADGANEAEASSSSPARLPGQGESLAVPERC